MPRPATSPQGIMHMQCMCPIAPCVQEKIKQRCTSQCHKIPTPGLQPDAPPGLACFGLRHWLEMKEDAGVLFHSGGRWRVAWAFPWYGNQSDSHEDVICGNAGGWVGLVGVDCLCCMSRAFFMLDPHLTASISIKSQPGPVQWDSNDRLSFDAKMPRDFQCENRTSLAHFTQFLYVCLAPRLFSVQKKEGKRKKSLIAPIVAVSEETCVGDSKSTES